MTILVGYWVLYANTSVGWNLLVAVGQIRKFALCVAAIATLNVALSLALTPSLGLNGVVLGTAIPYVLAVPVFLRMVPVQFGVRVSQLAREAWLPAYSTGAVIAAALVALRATVDLATLPACAAAGLGALVLYGLIYGAVWLRPEERMLARTLVHGFLGR
jgi:O-antigen/teichoic acid export membrane protein